VTPPWRRTALGVEVIGRTEQDGTGVPVGGLYSLMGLVRSHPSPTLALELHYFNTLIHNKAWFTNNNNDHYARGVLLTPEPESDQMFSGDEVGSNPAGGRHGRRVFCSMLRKQVVKVTGGEGGKATFWVTFFYWARFDGQSQIPPCVVHEGGELCELFAKYLPSDWLVHVHVQSYNHVLVNCKLNSLSMPTHHHKDVGALRVLWPAQSELTVVLRR